MAIYHLSAKAVQRTTGRSSVAASAYRAGEDMHDERTDTTHEYARRSGVAHTAIVGFSGSRSDLWNTAEKAEKRKDATTAREYEVAIPAELTEQQRIDLINAFADYLHQRHGCAVDLAIHEPRMKKDGTDNQNWHAHLLTTTRPIINGNKLGAEKCAREWSDTKRKKHDMPGRKFELEHARQQWAILANHHLAAAGVDEYIDHRSHAERGMITQPHVHQGPRVSAMERKGVDTRVGDINRSIDAGNNALAIKHAPAPSPAPVVELVASVDPSVASSPIPTPKPAPTKVVKEDPPALDQDAERRESFRQLQAELAKLQQQHQRRLQIEARLEDPAPDSRALVDKHLLGMTVKATNETFSAKQAVHDADHRHRVAADRYDSLSWFKRNFSLTERRALNHSADRLEAAEARLAKAGRLETRERKRQRPAAVSAATAEWKEGQKQRKDLEKRRDQLPDADQVQRQQQALQQHPEYQRQQQERQRRKEQSSRRKPTPRLR